MGPKRKLINNASSKAAKRVQTTLTSAITSTISATEAATDTLGLAVPQAITTAAAEIAPTNNDTAATQGHDYDALIVNRTYYPPVLSNERCQAYLDGNIPTPHTSLTRALVDAAGFRTQVIRDRAVVCWFRTDLRWDDNTALAMASTLAAGEVPVIGLFVLSLQDLDAHLMSPARTDFMLRSLQVLKDDLDKKGIPLYCETAEKRKRIPGRVLELAQEWRAKQVFANMEYEVDELRRDEKCVSLGVEKGVAVHVVHDTCIVPPDVLLTKVGSSSWVMTRMLMGIHVVNQQALCSVLTLVQSLEEVRPRSPRPLHHPPALAHQQPRLRAHRLRRPLYHPAPHPSHLSNTDARTR